MPLEGHAIAINVDGMSETYPPSFFRGLGDIEDQLRNGRLPPVERWNPPYCGDIGMRISRDGQWHYAGSPIRRATMVRLFSTILRRDEDGAFYLVTPAEKILVTVELAPFIAVAVEVKDGHIVFTTNVGDEVVAGDDHLIWVDNGGRVDSGGPRQGPLPFVHVRGRLEALIARPVFYELVAMASTRDIDGQKMLGVDSGGVFFALGNVSDDDAA